MRDSNKLSIDFVTFSAMKSFLYYIYTDNVSIKSDEAVYFMNATDYYGLYHDTLARKCRSIVKSSLCIENSLQILEIANEVGAKDVKDAALSVIVRNFSVVGELAYLDKCMRCPEILVDIIRACSKARENNSL